MKMIIFYSVIHIALLSSSLLSSSSLPSSLFYFLFHVLSCVQDTIWLQWLCIHSDRFRYTRKQCKHTLILNRTIFFSLTSQSTYYTNLSRGFVHQQSHSPLAQAEDNLNTRLPMRDNFVLDSLDYNPKGNNPSLKSYKF